MPDYKKIKQEIEAVRIEIANHQKYSNGIIDIYQGNKLGDISLLISKGIVGIIHKASENLTADTQYTVRRTTKLLWGAYHFMRPGNGTQQADFFILSAKPDLRTLVALDLEDRNVPLVDAEVFVNRIKDRLGRYPVLYSNASTLNSLGVPSTSVLHKCDFWVANPTSGPTPTMPRGWSKWSLWQYQEEVALPGVSDCDVSKFSGNNLSSWWAS